MKKQQQPIENLLPEASTSKIETAENKKQVHVDDHDYLAYLLQAIACTIWTCSYVYTNQHKFNLYQVNIAKGAVGTVLNYAVLKYRGFGINFQSSKYFKWLLILNICIISYFYALPYSQQYLPLPIVHTIGCSSIAITYLIDYFMNGTKITFNGFIGVIFAFVGVLFMANNRLILSIFSQDTFQDVSGIYLPSSVMLSSFVAFVLFIARLMNCYSLVKIKHFPQISIFELNLHNNILGLFVGAVGYMFMTKHVPFQIFWPSFLTMGVGQFICLTCFFYSLKLTKKTGNVMVINALNIIVAFFLSYFRYGEKINAILIAGSLGITIGMVIILVQTMKMKRMTANKIKQNNGVK